MEPLIGTFHDALTGETITRELTEQEVAALPQPDELAALPELDELSQTLEEEP
jgi:hypothetical protein